MARSDRLRRLRTELWMLEESPDGLTAREIAGELGVSKRTAQRDLLTLRASGHPLTSTGGRWRFIAGGSPPAMLAADGASRARERDAVLRLDRAIHARRPIEAVHLGLDDLGPVTLRLAPLYLEYLDGSLFLIAREHPSGPLRTLAVARLTNLRSAPGRVPPKASAGLEEYQATRFRDDAARELVKVTVRVSREAADRLEARIWHPSQRVTLEADGSCRVTFRVPGFAWVKGWALSLGDDALVLDPPELIVEICSVLERAREAYCSLESRLPQLDLFKDRK